MHKGITNRITMQELVDALNTMTYEEVTEENLRKALPLANIDFVNEVNSSLREGMKDISIDDYIFTIHRDSHNYPKEWILIGYPPTKSYLLSDYVEIWLTDSTGDEVHDFQAEGYITNCKGNLVLKVKFTVD